MSTYQTEEEQVEALKKWWKDNGKAIVFGAVVGLGAVFGWQGWERYEQGQAELAASYYSEFSNTLRAGNDALAVEQGERLINQFAGSAYADFAALELARIAYAAGEPARAAERLQWLSEHAADPVLGQLARLRLARLKLDQGDLAGARAELAAADAAAYPAQLAELRGDIARSEGDLAAAAEAYQAALDAGAENADLILMKLADTGHAPAG